MDHVPVTALFLATVAGVFLFMEAGFRLGSAARRRSDVEKEASIAAIAGTVLSLLAFILAFAFSIVTNRYDARKALVREEANAIGTAYLRSDFLPEADRAEAAALFREYVDRRVAAVQSRDFDQLRQANAEALRIQDRLWKMAVANARTDVTSEVAALYVDSLNRVIDIHALRVVVGVQTRLPGAVWLVLYVLILAGMTVVGYQAAIAGSTTRSWAAPILAISFSLVMALIASLDDPRSGFITVSQQPLVDVRASMGNE